MITVTEQPYSIATMTSTPAPPVPVSDCWRWCLQADTTDAVSTVGAQATVVLQIPTTCSVPANGTALKVWGYDFTVQSAVDYSSSSFKADAAGITTLFNITSMFQSNLFFNRAVTITGTVITGGFELTLLWNECREQPRFTGSDMVFTAITSLGGIGSGVATNGTSPVYVDGFRIVTRIGRYVDATSEFLPLTKLEGVEVEKLCTEVGEVCIDYKNDAETQLYTRLPDLSITSFIDAIENGRSLMRLFGIEYGWVYREDCQALSGTIKKSNIVLGINAAFSVDEPYGMRRYWYDHPDGFPAGVFVPEFLTTQPKNTKLCADSFAWLWLTNNFEDEFGGAYTLVANFIVYKKGVDGIFESFEHTLDNNEWYQPVCFNVSPGFVSDNGTLAVDEIAGYLVQVEGQDGGGAAIFNASEYLRFTIKNCCESGPETDLYVLTPAGGIATQVVTIQERQVFQEGQEVFITTSCDLSRADRARYGGRKLSNVRAYEKITFSIVMSATPEHQKWMRHIRQSPQHWLRVLDEDGEPIAKKLILEPGSVRTFTNGEGINFEATGYFADIATQKGFEPI
jgi:hypothetical protein